MIIIIALYFRCHINISILIWDIAKELLQRILCVNTAKRYTAKEILHHSWITVHIYLFNLLIANIS